MSNKYEKSKFIYPFGPKKSGCNEFLPEMDICDPRAPVNHPEDLYLTIMKLDEEVMDEIEDEKITDFDDDVYEYEDRTDFGLDIAAMQQAELAEAAGRLAQRRKQGARRE